MFLYCENAYNPDPEYTLIKREKTKDIKYVEHLSAPAFLLPRSVEEFEALKGGKYWYNLRRSEKKFVEEVGPLEFAWITDVATVSVWMPRVFDLFREKWIDRYTSSTWKTEEGFSLYKDALLALAEKGEGSLAVLYSGENLLAFSYNLHKNGIFYFYQHAISGIEKYAKYSLGKVFLAKLLREVIGSKRFGLFDFMIGEAAYKLEWANFVQKVYLKVPRRHKPYWIYAAYYLLIVAKVAFLKNQFLKQITRDLLQMASKVQKKDVSDGSVY